MNKEQQRIKIAEACGYKNVHALNKWKEGGAMSDGTLVGDLGTMSKVYVPDYTSDLNAMHEAEKVLDLDQSYEYGQALAMIVREPENIAFKEKPARKFPLNGWGHFHVAHLTAFQRSEAFLKTLNLWTES